jgi:para-nitrobenzyl esterase
MVWIHGGAFVFGSGGDKYYAGDHLASTYGVVIVTLNYRLGAFGFMAHPALDTEDPAYPSSGNYGLEDQRFALEWVQRNIAAFGGDPSQVTIFGESAGGFSTCALYVSPRTHGLFHAAISESGLCAGRIIEQSHAAAIAQGTMAGASLGCAGSDASAVTCLRAISSDDLLAGTSYPHPQDQMPGGTFFNVGAWLPQLPNIDGFVLPMSTADALASGSFEPRPLLLGSNHDEGTLLQSQLFAAQVMDDSQYHDALVRRFSETGADAILARYPSSAFPSPNRAIAEVVGDSFFVCPARRAARGAASHGAPVFRYAYTHPIFNPAFSDMGVFHSSEIPFVFGNDDFPLGEIGPDGAPVVAAMGAYWTSFAKTGTPTDAGSPAWPPYDLATDAHLVIGDQIAPGEHLKPELCDFWDTVLPVQEF